MYNVFGIYKHHDLHVLRDWTTAIERAVGARRDANTNGQRVYRSLSGIICAARSASLVVPRLRDISGGIAAYPLASMQVLGVADVVVNCHVVKILAISIGKFHLPGLALNWQCQTSARVHSAFGKLALVSHESFFDAAIAAALIACFELDLSRRAVERPSRGGTIFVALALNESINAGDRAHAIKGSVVGGDD